MATQKGFFMRRLIFLLVLLLAACDGGSSSSGETGEIPLTRIDIGDAKLLVWTAPGAMPGQHSAPGQIAYIDEDGKLSPLVELPQGTVRVQACGEQPTSPDGRYFAFFAGGLETGTLYMTDGDDDPEQVGEVHAMTCLGGGTFQFAPDSKRFGLIDFPSQAQNADFPAGTLAIAASDSRETQGSFDNVVAFDFGLETVGFVGLFTNTSGQAVEAGLFQWRSGTPDEITTVFPDNGCRFRSADVTMVGDDSMVAILGQSCGRQHGWMLYTVDIVNRSAALALSGSTGRDGSPAYYANARTNAVFVAPNRAAAYYSYPNGLGTHIADWYSVQLAAIQPGEPIITVGVMPRFVGNAGYVPENNAAPVASPDGRWVAVVSNTASNQATLHIIDLNAPDLPPIDISAGNPGDTVSTMLFTRDSARLLFVAGGHSGGNNSLFSVDLHTATDSRLVRGRYAPPLVLSPDGQYAAAMEWQIPTEPGHPNYLNLVTINLSDNQVGGLYGGIRIVEGRVTDQRFAYPLSWRK